MQYRILIVLIATACCFNILPELEIDLSGPPKQRWREAVRLVLDTHGFENSFGPVFEFHNKHAFSILKPNDYIIIAKALRRNHPEYSLELEGIVEEINNPQVTFEYMAAWAYFHEIGHVTNNVAECTGVLVSVGDQIIHGRNMDQQPGQARNLVLHLTIKKDGKYLGETVDWYWFKGGFITFLKYDVASVEENWRFDNHLTKEQVFEFIEQGVPSVPMIFRYALENEKLNSFETMVSYLETNTIGCAMFTIIGGRRRNEGVIISRDPYDQYSTLTLENTGQGFGDYQYMVQTNYDHWLPDPSDDPRRTAAENLLSELPIKLWNEFGIYTIMNSYPIHNEWTFLTMIMNAKYNRIIVFGQSSITIFNDTE